MTNVNPLKGTKTGFKTCGPNEALVISGFGMKHPELVLGGRKWVWGCFQRCQRISLKLHQIQIASPHVYSSLGVPVNVTATAMVKVDTELRGANNSHVSLHKACKLFLGKNEAEIIKIVEDTLEGHQRAIIGNMTVEQIYQDRVTFANQVFDVASTDLINMGMKIQSYTIKDVSDGNQYLQNIGRPRTAQVKANAKIKTGENERDQLIATAEAMRIEQEAVLINKTEIAAANRDKDVKVSEYKVETETARATAELAYPLQEAILKQDIVTQELSVEIMKKQKQIDVETQEIERKSKQLESQVKQPAQASKYKVEVEAEAEKRKLELTADAEAAAIRAKANATADAINAKAEAEQEAMQKKAAAFREYQDAAMVEMVLNTLPKLAAEVAAPICNARKITMVAGDDGDLGASKITSEVLSIMSKLPVTIEEMTGVDISKAFQINSAS